MRVNATRIRWGSDEEYNSQRFPKSLQYENDVRREIWSSALLDLKIRGVNPDDRLRNSKILQVFYVCQETIVPKKEIK